MRTRALSFSLSLSPSSYLEERESEKTEWNTRLNELFRIESNDSTGRTHTQAHTHAHAHTRTHTHAHTHTRTNTYTHITHTRQSRAALCHLSLIHTHTHTHTHTQGGVALHHATSNGSAPAIKYLLDRGTPISIRDDYNWTALHRACEHGHFEAAECLLREGAEVSEYF